MKTLIFLGTAVVTAAALHLAPDGPRLAVIAASAAGLVAGRLARRL